MVFTRPMISLTTFTFPFVLVLFFSTCCLGRPSSASSNYRRAYNYFPPMMADFPAPVNLNNPWELAAQEPLAYDQPEDPFDQNLQWTDMQALSNLLDAYDNSRHWGRIVNEMPEEYPEEDEQEQQPDEDDFYAERQLAELKRSSHPRPAESFKFRSFESPAPTSAPVTIAAAKTATKPPVKKLFLGQKEIPLLRPPNNHPMVKPVPATMSTTTGAPQVAPANGIVAAQLTTSTERQKKPSPYDTLREYLTIEDQIKQEAAAKRRLETLHEVKRSGRSTAGGGKFKHFVADEATLTGQLSSLRKSVA